MIPFRCEGQVAEDALPSIPVVTSVASIQLDGSPLFSSVNVRQYVVASVFLLLTGRPNSEFVPRNSLLVEPSFNIRPVKAHIDHGAFHLTAGKQTFSRSHILKFPLDILVIAPVDPIR